jgi:hypothetical protein
MIALVEHVYFCLSVKVRVWRYQRGYHNLYIKEEQTTQWPKEKVQKDKQWYTKHIYQSKDQTPLKTGNELRCSNFLVLCPRATIIYMTCQRIVYRNLFTMTLSVVFYLIDFILSWRQSERRYHAVSLVYFTSNFR